MSSPISATSVRNAPRPPAGTRASTPPSPPSAGGAAALADSGGLFRRVDWITFLVTTVLVLIGYLITLSPDLTLEDSGELAVGSMYAGVPHPPGYPVWTLYTWLFTKLLPFSNIAFRVSVSSAVAAAASAGLVGLLVSRGSSMILEGVDLFKDLEKRWENPLCLVGGIVSGLLIGFNGYIWSQAVIVEVYTLAVLTFMGMLALLLRWIHRPDQRRFLYLALFLFGLCFCNHQTLIVAAIGIVFLVLAADRKLGRDFCFFSAAVYALVIVGRAFGWTAILSDNAGVFTVFNGVGILMFAAAYAATGEMSPKSRWWVTGIVAGVLALLFLNYNLAALTLADQSAKAGQLVAQGRSAEQLILELHGLEGGVSVTLKLLAGGVIVATMGLFGLSYGTEPEQRLMRHWWPLVACGLCFAAGAAFYFYMPLASMTNPPMNWGYPRTAEGFVHAFTRGQYEKTNPSLNLWMLFSQIQVYAQGAKEEFNWANLLIGLVPFAFLNRMQRRERAWIFGLTAIYLCLAFVLLILLNPGVDRQSRGMVKVFFTSSHVIIALAVGYGIALIGALLLTRFNEVRLPLFVGGFVVFAFNLYEFALVYLDTEFTTLRFGAGLSVAISVAFIALLFVRQHRLIFTPFLALFLLIPGDSILSHWAENEQRGHYFGFWFGHDMFEPGMDTSAAPAPKDRDGKPLYASMAKDAVLYGGTDPGRFCPTYMIFCESFIPPAKRRNPNFDRRDVYLITQNALADNTYLDYIRAHYNRSAQVDPPFFQGFLNDAKSTSRGRTNELATLSAPLDHFFTSLGESIEKERRAGSSFFQADHFTDLAAFRNRLSAGADPLSTYLRQKLGGTVPADAASLAVGLNKILDGPSIGDDMARFENVKLSNRVRNFARQNPPTANRVRLNRLLLEESYPGLIRPSLGGLFPDREILTASVEDLGRCYRDYTDDAARRYSLGQLEAGEVVTPMQDGRISVSGQVAVMAINGLLTKVMFDKNPDHEFYIEESFPLKWMYPHLTPYGIIMKIERQPVAELTEVQMQRDHEFWSQYAGRFVGNWIKDSTPIKDICSFVLRTYQRRDLTGFTGDPKFVRDDNAQKAFSKLRNAQGKSIYAWRAQNTQNPVAQQRYLREAEFALKQAFAFCPYSPETTWNLASLLAATGRSEDAYLVAKTCEAFDLENGGIRDLVNQLDRVRKSAGTTPVNSETLANLEAQVRSQPTNFAAGFQAAAALYQSGRSNEAVAVFDRLLAGSSDMNQLLQLAEGYREIIRPDRMEATFTKITVLAPSSADGWLNLAQVQNAIGKLAEARASLEKAFVASDAQLKTNPAVPNLRKIFPTDPRFEAMRPLLKGM